MFLYGTAVKFRARKSSSASRWDIPEAFFASRVFRTTCSHASTPRRLSLSLSQGRLLHTAYRCTVVSLNRFIRTNQRSHKASFISSYILRCGREPGREAPCRSSKSHSFLGDCRIFQLNVLSGENRYKNVHGVYCSARFEEASLNMLPQPQTSIRSQTVGMPTHTTQARTVAFSTKYQNRNIPILLSVEKTSSPAAPVLLTLRQNQRIYM